jgi:negative regulator of genetic competence, sporulation and motility
MERKEMIRLELLRVTRSKLKISLDKEDMARFSLFGEKMDYEDEKTRRAFRKILSEVREQTGFDTEKERVIIRVFPSKDGGCEMFVTKIGEEEPCPASAEAPPPREVFYRFGSFSALIAAAALLTESGYDGESALFGEREDYYLSLVAEERSPFLGEFSEESFSGTAAAAVREHFPCLVPEGAVRLLYRFK